MTRKIEDVLFIQIQILDLLIEIGKEFVGLTKEGV